MLTAEHIDYLNEVIDTVDRIADDEPTARVADLIDVAFGLIDPADYGADVADVAPTTTEREYVKAHIR